LPPQFHVRKGLHVPLWLAQVFNPGAEALPMIGWLARSQRKEDETERNDRDE
jgi:hypothetical protein